MGLGDLFKDGKPTDDDLRECISFAKNGLEQIVANGTESIVPMIFVFQPPEVGFNIAIAAPDIFDTDDTSQKRALLFNLGRTLFKQKAIPMSIVLVCEAWCSILEEEESKESLEKIMQTKVSERDDKFEIVMINCVSINQKMAMRQYEIRRKTDSNQIILFPSKMEEIIQPCSKDHRSLLEEIFVGFASEFKKFIDKGDLTKSLDKLKESLTGNKEKQQPCNEDEFKEKLTKSLDNLKGYINFDNIEDMDIVDMGSSESCGDKGNLEDLIKSLNKLKKSLDDNNEGWKPEEWKP